VHESVVGAILELPQPQLEQSARVLLDVGHQYVLLVLALLLRPFVRITRCSVAAPLVVVPNNRSQTNVLSSRSSRCIILKLLQLIINFERKTSNHPC